MRGDVARHSYVDITPEKMMVLATVVDNETDDPRVLNLEHELGPSTPNAADAPPGAMPA